MMTFGTQEVPPLASRSRFLCLFSGGDRRVAICGSSGFHVGRGPVRPLFPLLGSRPYTPKSVLTGRNLEGMFD